MANLKNITINEDGFLTFPVGTTSQRPSNPTVGMMRVNTDRTSENILEYYDGSDWSVMAGFVPYNASGGSESDVTINGINYRIHAFTSIGNSTFTVSEKSNRYGLDVLIVAGGGGAGGDVVDTGGGGAGGLIYAENFTVSEGTYTITVGDGSSRTDTRTTPQRGDDSSAFGLTAIGGGGGAGYRTTPGNGGSGGGASEDDVQSGGQALQPTSSDGGFGNPGGGNSSSSNEQAAGGGGAGQPGDSAQQGGDGGDGLYYGDKFTENFGENGWFAGGGGGGGNASGAGGLGGGGNGNAQTGPAESGQPNTGGGGGGAANAAPNTGLGGNGGSGIVLIRYRI